MSAKLKDKLPLRFQRIKHMSNHIRLFFPVNPVENRVGKHDVKLPARLEAHRVRLSEPQFRVMGPGRLEQLGGRVDALRVVAPFGKLLRQRAAAAAKIQYR